MTPVLLRAAGRPRSDGGLRPSDRLPGGTASGINRGFTLIETMIAIGLMTMLMAGLYSALNIYYKLRTDSHDEIERMQIARTLLRQMSRDVQSVVFEEQKAAEEESTDSSSSSSSGSSSSGSGTSGTSTTGSSSSGSSSGSGTTGGSTSGSGAAGGSGSGSTGTSSGSGSTGSGSSGSGTSGSGTTGTSTAGTSTTGSSSSTSTTSSTETTATADPAASMLAYTNGLVGTATDLLLYVNRPDRDLNYISSQELSAFSDRSGDLMIVRYFVAESGAGGLASEIADREGLGGDSGPVGLVRMTGDLYGLSVAINESEEQSQISAAQVQCREVSQIRFQYFDGSQWLQEWDSTQLNMMPQAVEITLTLRTRLPADSLNEDTADPYRLGETTHRMVVNLPVAKPFVAETAL